MPSVRTRDSGSSTVGELIELSDERTDARVLIAPARGAIVASFRVGERELLYLDDATLRDATKNVRGGIPILFPTPGKLEDDRWSRAGHNGSLKQHGFARTLPWQIGRTSDAGAAEVTLGLSADAQTRAQYPWAFELDVTFRLQGASLRIATRLHSRADTPLPFALGFHPYFYVTDKARARILTFATRAFDNVTKQVGPFGGFDLTANEVDQHLLDHGDSRCELQLGDGARIVLDASPDYQLWVVWTLAGKDFVCVEPWTAPGNALNSGDHLLELAPGRTHESSVEITFHR
jgi:galactose mutarotase-like enzyme